MEIYNTLTKSKEKFAPINANRINMFVCGPTVYDFIHIGNARTFVFFDFIAKYLRYSGFEVNYIQNITDIDDKIIQKASGLGQEAKDLAKEYENHFKEDMKNLGVDSVSNYARATDHIDQVVDQVQRLIDTGHAYFIENDGYYFDLSTFKDYGKLSKRTANMADDAVSRIDDSDKKRNKGDFALWKISKPGEPSWETKLGKGRPGWHIEDTAITEFYFGPQYDLHGGGQDLIFPHHEAEIAQQESASSREPFVKYWMHVAFIVNKQSKMSKSLGNFKTARELTSHYSKEALRFYLLSGHYRSPLNFDEELIKQSQAAVNRISEFKSKLERVDGDGIPELDKDLDHLKNEMIKSIDDDINLPQATSFLFEFIRKINPLALNNKISRNQADKILNFLNEINEITGFISTETAEINLELEELLKERESARQTKDWPKADEIRLKINSLGYSIEDTLYGPLVKKLK